MKKWIRHTEPKDKKRGLYIVWYDYGTEKEFPVYMNENTFRVAKLEKELIEKGCDELDLEEYREAVYDMASDETAQQYEEE